MLLNIRNITEDFVLEFSDNSRRLELSKISLVGILQRMAGHKLKESMLEHLINNTSPDHTGKLLKVEDQNRMLIFIFTNLLAIRHLTGVNPRISMDINIAIYEGAVNSAIETDKHLMYLVLDTLRGSKIAVISPLRNYSEKKTLNRDESYIKSLVENKIITKTFYKDVISKGPGPKYEIALKNLETSIDKVMEVHLKDAQLDILDDIINASSYKNSDNRLFEEKIDMLTNSISWE